MPPASRWLFTETLNRLERADVFDDRDAAALENFQQVLVEALNALRPGFGTYALNEDTRYDEFLDPEVERLRRAMEAWKRFRNARQVVLDRAQAFVTVEKLLAG